MLKDTKSPDDIIWYNRGVARSFQLKRTVIVTIIILMTIFVIFILFNIETSQKIYISYRKSPPGVDCSNIIRTYSNEELKSMAGMEYYYMEFIKQSG